MKEYQRAGGDVYDIIGRLMGLYHTPLADAGVTVDAVFIKASRNGDGDATGDAITVGGYKAVSCVRITPPPLRALNVADAQIYIDEDEWEILGDDERDALIDHELTHLESQTKPNNEGQEIVQRDGVMKEGDSDGRPKLKMRRHDIHMGLFDEVVRRHKEASPEVRAWKAFEEHRQQQWLPYIDADKPKRIAKGV